MSNQMNKEAAQVADPVLTNVAIGFGNPDLVGDLLFPPVEVYTNSGKIITFGKEARMLYDTERAPGAATKQVMVSYGSDRFSLPDHSLDAITPRELARQGQYPGIKLQKRGVRVTRNAMLIEQEYKRAALARDLNNYGPNNKVTLTGAARWTDPASDPLQDVEDAKDQIRIVTGGFLPNVMIISYSTKTALRRHPKVLESVKFTGTGPDPSKITTQMLAAYFGVDEVKVGQGSYADGSGNFVDFWGDDVILAFVQRSSISNEMPSFGYTYQLENHPFVEEVYFDRRRKSWVNGVSDAYQPIITMPNAAFVFQNAGDKS